MQKLLRDIDYRPELLLRPGSLMVEALAAPDTINALPEKALRAVAARGRVSGTITLQREGSASFVKSWNSLLERIAQKSSAIPRQETCI